MRPLARSVELPAQVVVRLLVVRWDVRSRWTPNGVKQHVVASRPAAVRHWLARSGAPPSCIPRHFLRAEQRSS